jgi:hypothetical protein
VFEQAYYHGLIAKASHIDALGAQLTALKLELDEKKKRHDLLQAQLSVAEAELRSLHARGPPLSFGYSASASASASASGGGREGGSDYAHLPT